MHRSLTAALATACLVASGTTLRAEEPARLSEVCKAEIASLCAAEPKAEGKGRGHRGCLEQHQAKLGPACAGAVKTAREQREKVRVACEADRARHCQDADTKSAGAVQCLRSKHAELAKPCAEALAAMPQRSARQ